MKCLMMDAERELKLKCGQISVAAVLDELFPLFLNRLTFSGDAGCHGQNGVGEDSFRDRRLITALTLAKTVDGVRVGRCLWHASTCGSGGGDNRKKEDEGLVEAVSRCVKVKPS